MKITKALLLMGILLVALTGLSYAAPSTLIVWADQGEIPTFEKIAEKFTEETGIRVEFVEMGMLDQRQRLALDGPAGLGPDLFTTPHDLLGQLAIMGLVEPIKVRDEVRYAFTEASIQALSFDGELYGLPWATESTILYYNKDIYPEIPATFEEFYELVKAATKGNQYGLLFDIGNLYFNHKFFAAHGGYVFAPLEGGGLNPLDVGLDNKGAVEAGRLLRRMIDDGVIPIGTDTGISQSTFLDGRAGAIISGPWYLQEPRALRLEGKLNFGVIPVPAFAHGGVPSPFSGVKGFWVSSYSKYPEEALKLMEYLTSHEASFRIYQELSQIPARLDVLERSEFQKDEDMYNFALQASLATPMPNIPEMQTVWGNMGDAMSLIINDNVDPAIALEFAVEMIREGIMEMMR